MLLSSVDIYFNAKRRESSIMEKSYIILMLMNIASNIALQCKTKDMHAMYNALMPTNSLKFQIQGDFFTGTP